MLRLRGNELFFALVFFVVFIVLAAIAYFATGTFVQQLLVNLATVFFAAGLGLWVVNVYLEHRLRREAVAAFIDLVWRPIVDQHNALMDSILRRMGKHEWTELVMRYVDQQGDPKYLTIQQRDTIHAIVKTQGDDFREKLLRLERSMREVGQLLGWNFDPRVFTLVLRVWSSAASLHAMELTDTDENKWDVCAEVLNIEVDTFLIKTYLLKMAGLPMETGYVED